MTKKSALITISSYINPWEAHLAKGKLESEGIQAFVQNEHHISMNWPISQALGGVRLQVACADGERAFEIIQNLENREYKEKFPNDPQTMLDTNCPHCGSGEIRSRFPWHLLILNFLAIMGPAIFPIRRNRHTCLACKHKWKY